MNILTNYFLMLYSFPIFRTARIVSASLEAMEITDLVLQPHFMHFPLLVELQ